VVTCYAVAAVGKKSHLESRLGMKQMTSCEEIKLIALSIVELLLV